MGEAGALVAKWVEEHLDASVALRVCHMADHLEMADLGGKARAYVDRHFVEVAAHQDWLSLSAKAVEGVLGRDELRPRGELNVFHALVQWATAAEKEEEEGGGAGESGDLAGDRRGAFDDLLGRCVRLPLLGADELAG